MYILQIVPCIVWILYPPPSSYTWVVIFHTTETSLVQEKYVQLVESFFVSIHFEY